MTGLVWLALDGVGHPADAPEGSVWDQDLPLLRPLVQSGRALETRLGVEGLPQSGTGQSCWLTGQDAVQVMGSHFGPVPGPTLQRLLEEKSLPVRLAQQGRRAALVNTYAPAYLALPGRGRNRLGCFPYAFRAAGFALNPPDAPPLRAGLGLSYEAPWAQTAAEDEVRVWGQALGRAAAEFDLLVADLWLSDLLGHQGQTPMPVEVLEAGRSYLRRVEALLGGVLDAGARVVLSSDHGNLEDLSVGSHTLARVSFCGVGVDVGAAQTVVDGGQALARWLGLELGLDS